MLGRVLTIGALARHISKLEGVPVSPQHIRRAVARGYVPEPERIGPGSRVFLVEDIGRVVAGLRQGGYLARAAARASRG
jgi:hypothetical protein